MTDVDHRTGALTTGDVSSVSGDRQVHHRLREHLAQPFFRNSYSLVLNTGLTGLLGAGYWLLAARTYGESDVGRGSVSISMMTLLSGLVAFNLAGTLNRFIGPSGRRAGSFVLTVYLLTIVTVAVLATSFLLTLSWWGPSYAHLSGFRTGAWFVAATVAAAIFTLQDGVLTGLRKAAWVPVKNTVFGVAKIVLLVAFAAAYPRDGVYLSWVIPMAAVLLPMSVLTFSLLLPSRSSASDPGHALPTKAQVGRFFAGDYIGAVFFFLTFQFVPVLVATNVELYSFGYFYIAWTIGGLLIAVGMNMATSLTVEGAYDSSSISKNCRAAISRTVGLLLVGAVTVALAAPYALPYLGQGYLDASPLLQLLALASIPAALVDIYVGVLRAQNASGLIVRIQALRAFVVLGGVIAATRLDSLFDDLMPSTLTRIGVAFLLSQVLLAAVVFPPLRTVLGSPEAGDVPATELRAAGVAVTPAHETSGSPHREKLTQRSSRRIMQGPVVPLGLVVMGMTLGAVLFVTPLRAVDLGDLDGYGLISVLPAASFVGAGLLALTFLGTLALDRPRKALLAAQLVLWVGCLHGLPSLLESLPRFPSAWVHMGFVEYITRTGTTAPEVDARFSWPGFFALIAFLTDARSWQDLTGLVRLVPVLSNLLYVSVLALLLSNLRASWRAKWLAMWLFVVFNWIGQDYFSPQGLSYLLYLIFIAVLVTCFRPAVRAPLGASATRTSFGRLVPRFLRAHESGEVSPRPIGRREQVTLLALLLLAFAFTAGSHQLTPFLMIASCAGLILAKRCELRGLPVLLTAVMVAWISFRAPGYWTGHLDELVGGFGQLTSNVSRSVEGRAGRVSGEHLTVLYVRVGLALGVGALAAIGLWRRLRRGFDDRILLVLSASPLVAMVLQSYGGEMALRLYLFALPGICILAAYAFFPDVADSGSRRGAWRGVVAVALCTPLLIGGFLLARFGNEVYEYVRPGEVTALEHLYERHQGPATVFYPVGDPATFPTPAMVHNIRDFGRFTYQSVPAPRNSAAIVPLIVESMRGEGDRAYFFTTRSQEEELEWVEAYPQGWAEQFRVWMAESPELRIVTANEDAVVYELTTPGDVVEEAPPSLASAWTPQTGTGLVCLAALIGVLFGREIRRLSASRGRPKALLPWTLAAVPVGIGFLVVVVERLFVLT